MISYPASAFRFGQHLKTPVGSFDNNDGDDNDDCHDIPTIKMGHKRKTVEAFAGSDSKDNGKICMMSNEDSLMSLGLDLMLPILEEAASSTATIGSLYHHHETHPIGLRTPGNHHHHHDHQGPSKRQQRSPLLERYVPSATYAHFCHHSLPMQVRSIQATGAVDQEEEDEEEFQSLLSIHRAQQQRQYGHCPCDDDDDALPDSLWVPDMLSLDDGGDKQEETSPPSSSCAPILPVLRLQPKHPCDDLYWQTTRRTIRKRNSSSFVADGNGGLVSYSIDGDDNDSDDAPGPIKSMF